MGDFWLIFAVDRRILVFFQKMNPPPIHGVAKYCDIIQIGGRDGATHGGAWNNNADNLRCAIRNRNPPDNRNNNIGFRLVFGS